MMHHRNNINQLTSPDRDLTTQPTPGRDTKDPSGKAGQTGDRPLLKTRNHTHDSRKKPQRIQMVDPR
jgi:hypothetical protein